MLPGVGAIVEVEGPSPDSGRWDTATWDDPDHPWDAVGWRDVTGLAMAAEIEWGADRQVGVLSVTAAGRWTVRSYDPLRLFDPSNTASPMFVVLKPGTPVRLRYGALVVNQGWLDTVAYSLADRMGEWRASDGIPLMAQSRIALPATGAPTTLRALARWAIERQGLPITVEPDPPEGDPTVGPAPTGSADIAVWDWISLVATDVLHAVWLDPVNVLRFRSYGDPRDLGLEVGGAIGIPLEDVAPETSLDAVYNVVTAKGLTPAGDATAVDQASMIRYGQRNYDRDRLTPDAVTWTSNVVSDRANASLDYNPRTLRLVELAHLEALVAAGMVDTVRLRVESVEPPLDVSASLLGMTLRVDPESGWSGDIVCYVPAGTWDSGYEPEPPEPPVIPPATTRVTRSYNATRDSRLHRTSGGANYGSGTEGQLPVGAWQSTKNRALIGFASIPWGGVVKVVSATLRVTTSTQVNVGFGSAPKVEARRITAAWSEGSASSPSGSNAVKWPGPAATTTGAKQSTVTRSEGARVALDVTAIVRAWAPSAAGGSAAANNGIALYSTAESADAQTTEFLSRENGTAGNRPVLELVLDVAT